MNPTPLTPTPQKPRPHILILGAGFGGMYTARQLKSLVARGEADITIVNETNYFLFTPLLHEVATGSLSPQSVTEPLREIFAGTGVKICQGTVVSINQKKHAVIVRSDDKTKHMLIYDYLVLATGATTNYYNISGAEDYTYPLKTLADAIDIRRQIIGSFEKAIMCPDPLARARLLSFVVVGGGPTGVETVSELSDFVNGMVKRYYHNTSCQPNEAGSCGPEEPTVTLISADKELLLQFTPKLRVAALERLQQSGVTIRMNAQVTGVTPNGIELADKTTIPASTVIWAAGVRPSIPTFEIARPTRAEPIAATSPALVGNRLAVDEYFRMRGDDRIFVLGDAAGYIDTTKPPAAPDARPITLPMLAQVAVGQARIVAANIKLALRNDGSKLHSFEYHSKGSMVSVGQWFAMGEIFSMQISGPITWWIWRTVYLFKFISLKKRVRIVIDWTLNIFYPRDITMR